MFVAATLIIVYSTYRCKYKGFVDPFQGFPFGGQHTVLSSILDGWSFLHFCVFMFFGYMYPDKFLLVTIMGILWELFEWATSNTEIPQLKWIRGLSLCGSDADKKDGHFYYAKLSDIFMNVAGFKVGLLLANKQVTT